MNLRAWRMGGALICLLVAAGFLFSRLVFAPVPWPDGSAFYLPGLELIQWPPQWRMHAQAAFVPSYDFANFNLMPALPVLLGIAAHSGLLHLLNAPLLAKAVSLIALIAWAWLLWEWLIEAATPRVIASVLALAALLDPVLRWGTLVVRTETWIGLCWVWILRELWRWERSESRWANTAWRIAGGLALSAYFHFEAVFFVPAVIVGLGFRGPWFRRLLGIGGRTALFLSPWLLYVLLHFQLFIEQMQIQFSRLAHGNHWMSNFYMIFHSLFLDFGSPSGYPKFFNVAKGVFWILLAICAYSTFRTGKTARRTILAAAVAFASCFYLWVTKDEVWFITLCHLAFWSWAAAALLSLAEKKRKWRVLGPAAAYGLISFVATIAQSRAISPEYTWPIYQEWVSCLENVAPPLASKPGLKVWQPHVPDVLVELSHRHPTWDLTRALDFSARRDLALSAVRQMDVMLFTRYFNPPFYERTLKYEGPLRPDDQVKMAYEVDLPFAPWALETLLAKEAGKWDSRVCEVGPFWAAVISRKAPGDGSSTKK